MEKTIDINSRLFIINSLIIIVNQDDFVCAKLYLFSIITKNVSKVFDKKRGLICQTEQLFSTFTHRFRKRFCNFAA